MVQNGKLCGEIQILALLNLPYFWLLVAAFEMDVVKQDQTEFLASFYDIRINDKKMNTNI